MIKYRNNFEKIYLTPGLEGYASWSPELAAGDQRKERKEKAGGREGKNRERGIEWRGMKKRERERNKE